MAFLLIASTVFASAPKPQAVVAGTVFRDPGFTLRGAEVRIEAVTLPASVKKFSPVRGISDGRGEFSFRVPAGQARYRVRAQAPGFAAEEKIVDVTGEERVDVFFNLKPAAP